MEKVEGYLQKLYALSVEQNKALVTEDVDGFERLGEEREQVIEQMKAQCIEKETLNQVEQSLLVQLNEQDKQNAKILEKQMEEVKLQLRNLSMYSKRDKKYINNYPDLVSGRYFDK